MAKNLYLRVASKLYFDDNRGNIQNLCAGLVDVMYDSIDFLFPRVIQKNERKQFEDDFFKILYEERKKRCKEKI